jgi:hypothetical protein
VKPLQLTVFARWSWAQPATVLAGTTGEGAALASFRSLSVGSAFHCGGGHYSLASVRYVGMGSASHCGDWHDRRGRCSGLCSLGRRELKLPLWWRAPQKMALLWPLLALSARAQPATVVAGTRVEVVFLASVRLVCLDSATYCAGGQDR